MKYTRTIAGTIALLGLLSAAPVQAEGLSQYTQRALERIQAAEANIGNGNKPSEPGEQMNWWEDLVSGLVGVRTYDVLRTNAADELLNMTPCLYGDIRLLRDEMDKVKQRMNDGQGNQSQLSDLYKFISDRIRVLQWGATRVGYSDPTWAKIYSFDPKDASGTILHETLCPFSTDYAPLSIDTRYGCSPELMKNSIDGKEKQAVQSLLDKLQDTMESETFPGRADTVEGCQDHWPEGYQTWSVGMFNDPPGQRYVTLSLLLWNVELLRPSPFFPVDPFSWLIGRAALNPLLTQNTKQFSEQQAQVNGVIRTGSVDASMTEQAFAPFTKTVGHLSRLAHDIGGEGENKGLRDFIREFAYFLRRSCMNRDCNATLDRIVKIVTTDECFPYTSGDADRTDDMTEEQWKDKVQKLREDCADKAQVDVDSL